MLLHITLNDVRRSCNATLTLKHHTSVYKNVYIAPNNIGFERADIVILNIRPFLDGKHLAPLVDSIVSTVDSRGFLPFLHVQPYCRAFYFITFKNYGLVLYDFGAGLLCTRINYSGY